MTMIKSPPRALLGLHESVAGLVRRFVAKGSKILDIAAGSGDLTRRLMLMGYDVVANDIDPSGWELTDVELHEFPSRMSRYPPAGRPSLCNDPERHLRPVTCHVSEVRSVAFLLRGRILQVRTYRSDAVVVT